MIYKTYFGNVEIIVTNNILTELHFTDKAETNNNPPNTLVTQFEEYCSGYRKEFEVAYRASGTVFQIKVWDAIREIPYGSTATYKEIAVAIGKPKATRAVGMACNKNPLLLVIPCHRVISSTGHLTGYQGGIEIKRKLLELEQRTR